MKNLNGQALHSSFASANQSLGRGDQSFHQRSTRCGLQEPSPILCDSVMAQSHIRYPNNQCLNCAYLGLCIRKKALVEEKLVTAEELAVHG